MRIHPASAAAPGGIKKDLRRLPHVYSKVLELPLPADTDVAVFEGPDAFHFVVAAGGARGVVRVRTVRIHPGVVKVVVQAGEEEGDAGDMDIDRWRSRLPEASCPAKAVAGYVDGQLVVSVPKGSEGGHGGDSGEGDVTWRCCDGGKTSGRLVVVQ
ncbi:hypothetical protein PR202_gb18646 [Eleusine coracana subsp. coracana]|uniref:SHSP domain-containing protein n=1 Tax=Eleusine coracana subsp. coracana TaxID=191504 RepID=A0AAV5F5Y8_ELECO|nr:hypothetical protein QOZ80_3BG0293540 [Eleusine coracana subsp. coracana]GJN30350.1 hypothetical protein PR202_gb18646 [Eleusine coracana subsp. coracana]